MEKIYPGIKDELEIHNHGLSLVIVHTTPGDLRSSTRYIYIKELIFLPARHQAFKIGPMPSFPPVGAGIFRRYLAQESCMKFGSEKR